MSDGLLGNVFWSISSRWLSRLIGVISTLILVRVLTPEDFGIVALASVFVGLVEVMLELGVAAALIQNREATRDHFDTAWTFSVIQSAAAGLVISCSAPLVAHYYGDPRIATLLVVMGVSSAIQGWENIGVVSFQRELNFKTDFNFQLIKRVSGFVVTIGLAIVLHDYWALVFGTLFARLIGVGVSFWICDFRPKFSLAQKTEIWSFSKWVIVRSVGGYLDDQFHRLVVGKTETTRVLGVYTVSGEISAMPTSELLMPIGRVLFPAFSMYKNDSRRLLESYLLSLRVQVLLAIPLSVGLASVADNAVPVLLGNDWGDAVILIKILSLYGFVHAIGYSGAYLLTALGKIRVLAIMPWLFFSLFLGGVLILDDPSAINIAVLRLALGVLNIFAFFWLVMRVLHGLVWRDLLASCWRPIAAAAIMAVFVVELGVTLEWSLILELFCQIALGGFIYCATVLLLWYASGRPSGAEEYIIDKIRLYYRTAAN
ncbi:MAG: lipopolysaccharide biosynthesis protein [Zoogloeaceae bacterium]|nr:lipopolysaccharide biosynthesis protein [Zoogloeaceae bacterium]